MTQIELSKLPSPFYRVAIKALVFDANRSLLVAESQKGGWEIPGGGWEHDEALADCLIREFQEEIGVQISNVSDVKFVFQSVGEGGWHTVRIVVSAEVTDQNFKPGDDMVSAKYVTASEFLSLPFRFGDEPIKNYRHLIWPEVD